MFLFSWLFRILKGLVLTGFTLIGFIVVFTYATGGNLNDTVVPVLDSLAPLGNSAKDLGIEFYAKVISIRRGGLE
ncbi:MULTISPECIES: hypothetical protein [Vibrio]|uniref:hypothetical protein n=1 Tax=Vibrio TaxID=662 RepID=UPI000841B8F9|nr:MULTISPECIES: hypothetical protein [Vibrio]NMS52471.1 hypothetical protein [Vibrio parahaemolyticus]ODM56052.1 hypothetical protein BC455_22610 [Vibrio harveyi]USD58532.1 hypothetical protein J4N44_27955 [Vibrio sp. SCSIO 43155]